MSRQNRVTPLGDLIATSARGLLMGNRGCLHDSDGAIRRDYRGKRWITCEIEFKGIKRTIMKAGHYTELFFLDEATSLAAGHRPCWDCRRKSLDHFRECWLTGNGAGATAGSSLEKIDSTLHSERLPVGASRQGVPVTVSELPNGVFVRLPTDPRPLLLHRGELLAWSPFGYTDPSDIDVASAVELITPVSSVRAIQSGYSPGVHPSANAPSSGVATR